ncbi:hypothetical protein [Spiroplasma chinense]|uniref:hypothetical protein n=1 Tax=Spiroplasma chinense TaxID=216932 RepID=UPI001412DE78|nr:hypothetical protein [Spiroplasma chinense]
MKTNEAKSVLDREKRICFIEKIQKVLSEYEIEYRKIRFEQLDDNKQIAYLNKLKRIANSNNVPLCWKSMVKSYEFRNIVNNK